MNPIQNCIRYNNIKQIDWYKFLNFDFIKFRIGFTE